MLRAQDSVDATVGIQRRASFVQVRITRHKYNSHGYF